MLSTYTFSMNDYFGHIKFYITKIFMIIKFLRIRDTYDRIHFYYAPFIVLYEDEIEYIIHAYIYIYSIIARGQI